MRKTNMFLTLAMIFALFSGWGAFSAQQQAQALPPGSCKACDLSDNTCRSAARGYDGCTDGTPTTTCSYSGEGCGGFE